jgi:uncharacterized membrane protein YkoI
MTSSRLALLSMPGLAASLVIAATVLPARAEERTPDYVSSIRLDAKDQRGERAEAARYAGLARIDVTQAIAAAQGRVAGKALGAALENENGNLVYSVLVQSNQAGGAPQEVKVDAGNGAVLAVEAGEPGKDRDEEEEAD